MEPEPDTPNADATVLQPSPETSKVDAHALQQDPDIWMSDGNIIVAARDEENDTMSGFKCHQSVLAKQSTVFAELFTLNQPEGAELYEGVPVVALPDAAADVKALLRIIYDPTE